MYLYGGFTTAGGGSGGAGYGGRGGGAAYGGRGGSVYLYGGFIDGAPPVLINASLIEARKSGVEAAIGSLRTIINLSVGWERSWRPGEWHHIRIIWSNGPERQHQILGNVLSKMKHDMGMSIIRKVH